MWVVELNFVNQHPIHYPHHHQGTDIQKRKDTREKRNFGDYPKVEGKTHHFPGRLSNNGKCGNVKGWNVHHPSI